MRSAIGREGGREGGRKGGEREGGREGGRKGGREGGRTHPFLLAYACTASSSATANGKDLARSRSVSSCTASADGA